MHLIMMPLSCCTKSDEKRCLPCSPKSLDRHFSWRERTSCGGRKFVRSQSFESLDGEADDADDGDACDGAGAAVALETDDD